MEARRSIARRALSLAKRPARGLRNRLDRRRVEAVLRDSVEEAGHAFADLARLWPYFDSSFDLVRPAHALPDQRPYRYLSGLRAKPVWDPAPFEFVTRLVPLRERLLAEFRAYREQGRLAAHHQGLHDRGEWDVLHLFAGGEPQPAALAGCPETARAIADVPGIGVVGQAYFSRLSGKAHIPAHYGPTNARLRVQLPLAIGSGSEMRIADHLHRWDAGHEVLVFDDSFEHEVWIRGDDERIVFIFDFWHPDLTPAERWALERIDPLMPDRRRYRKGSRKSRASAGV